MLRIVSFAEEMVVIGIELHLELLVGLHECIDILHGMLHVYVVIARAVNDEYITGEVSGFVQQRGFPIPAVVHLRTSHVPLRIGAVV